MDVYPAPGGVGSADGAILYVHGGGWQGTGEGIAGRDLSGSGAPAFASPPAVDRGHRAPGFMRAPPRSEAGRWTLLSIDYRSPTVLDGASEGAFPAALHDVKVAIRYARKHYASGYGQKLVLMGHSAGAHLVVLAAMTVDDEARAAAVAPSPLWPVAYPPDLEAVSGRVDGVVALAGPLDLADWFGAIVPHLPDLADWPYFLSDQVAKFLRCRLPGVSADLTRQLTDPLEPCLQEGDAADGLLSTWARLASPTHHVGPDADPRTDRGRLDGGGETCPGGTCEPYPPVFVAYDRRDLAVPPVSGCVLARRYQAAGFGGRFWADVIEQDPPAWRALPDFQLAERAGVLPPPHAVLGLDAARLQRFFASVLGGAEASERGSHDLANLCE